jgi:hypothetical protein
MREKITLVVPEAPVPESATLVAQRPVEKTGLRLGILDNSKGNADHLLKFLVEGLRAAMPIASVLSLKKLSVGLAAPGTILDQFAAEVDYVVTAMAD